MKYILILLCVFIVSCNIKPNRGASHRNDTLYYFGQSKYCNSPYGWDTTFSDTSCVIYLDDDSVLILIDDIYFDAYAANNGKIYFKPIWECATFEQNSKNEYNSSSQGKYTKADLHINISGNKISYTSSLFNDGYVKKTEKTEFEGEKSFTKLAKDWFQNKFTHSGPVVPDVPQGIRNAK